MKELIRTSNKYRRFRYYTILYTIVYLAASIIIFLSVISRDGADIFGDKKYLVASTGFIAFGLFLLPAIIFYGVKLLLIVKNINGYVEYDGVITYIHTALWLRSDARNVSVSVPALFRTYDTHVYRGALFDEVARNVEVRVAYNEHNDDIIILGIK